MATGHPRETLPGGREKLLVILSYAAAVKKGSVSSLRKYLSRVLGAILHSAATKRDWILARALVSAGAEIEGVALHEAIKDNQEELAAFFVEHGASVSCLDVNHYTALHVAAQLGNARTTCMLIEKGAGKDEMTVGGSTPVLLASERGSAAVVAALASAGADTSLRDDFGYSPLEVALRKGYVDVVETMINLGRADVNAADDRHGSTPLHLAKGKFMVDLLVEAGANVDARNFDGRSPLNEDVRFDKMRALVSHGADVNAQDLDGNTPLHHEVMAIVSWTAKKVDFLLRSGADETIVNYDGVRAADLVAIRGCEPLDRRECDNVRALLAKASGDRAWRRRGLLLLCIANYNLEHWVTSESSNLYVTVAGSRESRRVVPEATRSAQEKTAGDLTCVAVWMAGRMLGKEDIFRTIVGYI